MRDFTILRDLRANRPVYWPLENTIMFKTHALNLAVSLVIVATLAVSSQLLAAGLASYSPGRDANLPMQLLWGDTHLHTTYSRMPSAWATWR